MVVKMKSNIYFPVILIGLCCTNPKPAGSEGPTDECEIESGISMQLIVSEPLVVDPVAFTFDEHQAMYVVEHRGYPDPAEGGRPAKNEGRIAKLSDLDQDGIYDHREEYAEGFSYPNGIMYWKGGVFLTCAPDIFYLKDTTGDGKADIRRVVLTGFHDTKTAQIRMSHPILGLDGWVYVTGGLNGGEITSPEYPNRKKIIYRSGDGRFHPETLEFQVTGGNSQFGLTMDPFGRRFGCSNRHPVQHIVMEPQDLARSPYLLHNETVKDVSRVQEKAVVYPISNAATSADFIPKLIGRSHKGTFTAASGLLFYADAGLGSRHQGNFFICESAQNLVQSQRVRPDGASFSSEISTGDSEFLACKNEWFRPVFLSHGPHPGLYIADMHRKVIDHPSYLPEAIRADLDFESGKGMGRIYRLASEDLSSQERSREQVDFTRTAGAVRLLASAWEWQRSMAFQILLERKDSLAIRDLREMAKRAELEESRVKCLWLLHLMGSMNQQTHISAFQDPSPEVREQAVRIAKVSTKHRKAFFPYLIKLSEDPDMRVRFMTSLALGSFENSQAMIALAKILARDGFDTWSRAAALSSVGKHIEAFLEVFQSQGLIDSTAHRLVMRDLGQMLGNEGSLTSCTRLFHEIIHSRDQEGWRISTCLGLVKGIHRKSMGKAARNPSPFLQLQGKPNESEHLLIEEFIQWISKIALNQGDDLNLRKDAISLLGFMTPELSFPILKRIVTTQQILEIKISAIKALTIQGKASGAKWLLGPDNWSAYTPQIRTQVLSVLIDRPEHIKILLEAVKNGIIKPSEISLAARERLMQHQNREIRDESTLLFAGIEKGDRMEVYEAYKLRLTGEGQAQNGKRVFERACSTCHSHDGHGGQVGPDLTGVQNQPADALLLHTLVPNYEVYPTYQAIFIELHSGESRTGWIKAETIHAVTICTAGGSEETILRSNIASIRNTGQSLMPEGLEQVISPDEMNDLIAFLKSGYR